MIHEALFQETLTKTGDWVDDLNAELGSKNEHRAWLALGSVLHALRDELPIAQMSQLGAQLPLLVRGLYYTGWTPSHPTRHVRSAEEFLAPVRKAFKDEPAEAAAIARAVFVVVARHITRGELDGIRHVLPGEIRDLFPQRRGLPDERVSP